MPTPAGWYITFNGSFRGQCFCCHHTSTLIYTKANTRALQIHTVIIPHRNPVLNSSCLECSVIIVQTPLGVLNLTTLIIILLTNLRHFLACNQCPLRIPASQQYIHLEHPPHGGPYSHPPVLRPSVSPTSIVLIRTAYFMLQVNPHMTFCPRQQVQRVLVGVHLNTS